MPLTESGSNSSTNCCVSKQRGPVFTQNCRGLRRFGPFRALCGHDARPLAVHQPLQVVTRRHHRHRKVSTPGQWFGSVYRPSAQSPQTHAQPARGSSRCGGSPLLGFGQRLVPMAFALNPVPVAVRLPAKPPVPRTDSPGRHTPPARIGRIDDRVEVLAVIRAGGDWSILRMNLCDLSTFTESL